MKILVVEPGPWHSTWDVFQGLQRALKECGHGVGTFALHNRIGHANACLQLRWEAADSRPEFKPSPSDVLFHASSEIVQYALYQQVDWVLFVSCGLVHPAVHAMLRRAGVPTALILTESPHEDERQAEVAREVDVVWTNERTSVPVLRQVNPNTFYLPHAYDPERHHPYRLLGPIYRSNGELSDESHKYVTDQEFAAAEVPRHDVVFVGTLWQERIDLLADVDWTGIDLGIYGGADLLNFERFPNESNAAKRAQLEPYLHVGFVENEHAAALYRAAKLGLNLHRSSVSLAGGQHIQGGESMNPRDYELAATGGALLLTDQRAEVSEVLGPAAPTFNGPLSLRRQIRYLLSHETDRQQRVGDLQAAIAPHTFAARAAQITADLAACRPISKGV